jgi:stage V sporulation protein S
MSDIENGVIKVSGKVNPASVASVLARAIVSGKGNEVKLRAVGAGAVNQASKACAIARGFVAPRGIDLSFILGFEDVEGDEGKTISALVWKPVVS